MKRLFWTIGMLCATALPAAWAAGAPLEGTQRLTLELEAVPVATVLGMIAQQNDLNLVMSGAVSGEVSVRLEEVDVTTALDAILGPMGYNYYLHNNVIVVKPYEDFAPGELVSRCVALKYIDPIAASKALTPLSSSKGSIVILDNNTAEAGLAVGYTANRLLLIDLPPVIVAMTELLAEIDKAERLVLIEAKIIERVVDDDSKVGFSWPSIITASLGSSDSAGISVSSSGQAATWDPNGGDWMWGKLSVGELKLVLDFLETSGNSKLISDPRITTLENHEAVIKIETIVPIATINRFTEGAATSDIVTFQDEEIGISLQVTPRINEDGKITLDVIPTVEDIIGYSGPIDNQKPITTSRSVQTKITVADGETAALGGLLKEDEIERVQRVPILGHIPLLGKLLFTRKSTDKSMTDLIILITPTILP